MQRLIIVILVTILLGGFGRFSTGNESIKNTRMTGKSDNQLRTCVESNLLQDCQLLALTLNKSNKTIRLHL